MENNPEKDSLRNLLLEKRDGTSFDLMKIASEKISKKLKKIGFNYDQEQVEKAKRKSGPHKGYAEYLFFK